MDLEIEILRELQTKELRPSDLLNKLFSKLKVIEPFQKTSAETFRTQMNRNLRKLTKSEEIKRTDICHQHVVYSIAPEGRKRLLALDINSYVNQSDNENLEILSKYFRDLRTEKREPNGFIFTFIGDVPTSFPKSIEALQRHLEQEERLYKKYVNEIDRIKHEVYEVPLGEPINWIKIGKDGWAEYSERVAKEVGWSFNDYLRRLTKKAKELPFPDNLVLLEFLPKEVLENNKGEKRLDSPKKSD